MNYSQTLEFLFSSMPTFQEEGATAYKPGLERIAAFCRHLGNPQRNFFTVHVAGTNGKGSVSHIIAAVLQQAGYRTGLFTSPHLHDFRERIRVDGEMIPKQKVVNFVDKHREKMTELGLSFFEMTAALAFDYFAQSDVEVAVIETGLGGRLDATNVILPIVSVITNIGLEHTALLGDTLQQIAAEKAGIIKKSIPVVLGEANDAYNDVFEHIAAVNKTHVTYAEREFSCEMQSRPASSSAVSDRNIFSSLRAKSLEQKRKIVILRLCSAPGKGVPPARRGVRRGQPRCRAVGKHWASILMSSAIRGTMRTVWPVWRIR